MAISVQDSFSIAERDLISLETLSNDSELSALLTPSWAANVFNRFCYTETTRLFVELAAFLFDKDRRTASLCNIIRALQVKAIRVRLLREHVAAVRPLTLRGDGITEGDSSLLADRWHVEEVREVISTFNEHWETLRDGFARLKGRAEVKRVCAVRHRGVAHHELVEDKGGKWRRWIARDTGARYGDPRLLLDAARPLVDSMYYLVMNGSFAHEVNVEGSWQSALQFWGALKAGLQAQRVDGRLPSPQVPDRGRSTR